MRNSTKIHQGRNIKRFREMLGMKQDALAWELGEDWNQQKISLLEQRETIEDNILKQIATVLKLPMEAIQNFDAEQAIHNINNNFHDNSVQNQFNPLEKIIELYENKILSLYDEKIALYERMLKEKDEMLQRLEMLINR
ncbi:MAG: XRE family transcriptional regulator [Flavobacteriales bacterium]